MDYRSGRQCGEDYILEGVRHFDLAAILDCGQAFRWSPVGEDAYQGIAFGRQLTIRQTGERLIFYKCGRTEFDAFWRGYFDFGRNYGQLKEMFARYPHLRQAVDHAPGIRVLNQDGWEALCTFILSQNNNIPRIKGLVARLCEQFGDEIPGGFVFPRPERLAGLSPEDLAPVRAGFRAKYIIAAANATAGGQVNLAAIAKLPLNEARAMLMTIHGVGPKVADCALLFGFGRAECNPIDVWMARVMQAWFPNGLPEEVLPVAGIAQQYLFHYARESQLIINNEQ
ncbi:MAG: DNA-3-methyladenine glycosylase 2 family protein [Oscillospiraceae bacterium]|nr:DNA-3-methyladenine glycosylase 2 family protein [Oscillospiraceae bacterium]